jgi:acetyl/propionyl-CoA carboxylase alpha subunit
VAAGAAARRCRCSAQHSNRLAQQSLGDATHRLRRPRQQDRSGVSGRDGGWNVAIDGTAHRVELERSDGESTSLLVADVHRTYTLQTRGRLCYVHSTLGTSDLEEVERFPSHDSEDVQGGCHAPMPGRVLEVGQQVDGGDILVVLDESGAGETGG